MKKQIKKEYQKVDMLQDRRGVVLHHKKSECYSLEKHIAEDFIKNGWAVECQHELKERGKLQEEVVSSEPVVEEKPKSRKRKKKSEG